MRKVKIEFASGDGDSFWSAADTDEDAAREVAGRVLQAINGEWGWAEKDMAQFVKSWYKNQDWAIAICGDHQIKVSK